MSNSDLVLMINSVFLKEPVPKVLLLEEEGIFQREIPDAIEDRFFGREWCVVTLDDWRNIAHPSVIRGCMITDAFHYYVPSLLIGVLDNLDFIDWGLEALIPNNASRVQKGKLWFDYFSLFSAKQRSTVLEFIEHIDRTAIEYVSCTDLEIARQIWSAP